jgi:hypothetical protein
LARQPASWALAAVRTPQAAIEAAARRVSIALHVDQSSLSKIASKPAPGVH